MQLADNLVSIQARMAAACGRVGRDPAGVQLMAVSKGQPPAMVRAAADLGLTLFGENKVQEGKAKVSMSPGRLHWHLIGHLQTNKCRDAVHFFELIQSVDSLHLAEEIDKAAARVGKRMPVLLEVNIAGESSKFGLRPEVLVEEMLKINALKRVEIHGLMTLAPWTPDTEKVRPLFRRLRELKLACEEALGATLPHLSMGMSGDFEVAVEEGATIVRIGTALFGPRGRAGAAGVGMGDPAKEG
jgi:pyridoxal phosphate enzyme (YggS family)